MAFPFAALYMIQQASSRRDEPAFLSFNDLPVPPKVAGKELTGTLIAVVLYFGIIFGLCAIFTNPSKEQQAHAHVSQQPRPAR